MDRIAHLTASMCCVPLLAVCLSACEGRQQQTFGGGNGQTPAPTGSPQTPGTSDKGSSGVGSGSGSGTPDETITPGTDGSTGVDGGADGLDTDDDTVTNTGLSPSELEQGRQFVNGWTGIQDEIPTSVNWRLVNVSVNSTPTGNGTDVGSGSGDPAVLFQNSIKPILDAACVSCHRAGGQRSTSPMTTYIEAKALASSIVSQVVGGTMPPGGSGIQQADRQKFQTWLAAENATGSGGTLGGTPGYGTPGYGTPGYGTPGGQGGTGTSFRIRAGTGAGPWNTPETTVVVRVGVPFTIYNDDSIVHQWHTNGAPCQHGSPIQPGQSETCTPSAPFNEGALYDHITEGRFYIRGE